MTRNASTGNIIFPIMLILVATLTGCDQPPHRIGAAHEVSTNSIGWCVGAWGGGEYVGRVDRAPALFAAVGYDKIFLPGAQPFPCGRSVDHRYAALLEFDVRGDPITRAILRPVELRPVTPAPRGRPLLSCEVTVSLAQEVWREGRGTTIPRRTEITPGTETRLTLGPVLADGAVYAGVDVTTIAQEWRDGSKPNLGFVLSFEDPLHSGDHQSCLYYVRMELQLELADGG